MQIGQTLHNGAVVMYFTDRVVLARWVNDITPFVTWKWDGKDPRSTAAGKYYTTLAEVAEDFETR